MIKGLLLAVILAAVAILGARFWLDRALQQPLHVAAAPSVFVVEAGDSLSAVLKRSSALGWLHSRRWIALWAKWNNLDTGLKIGEYEVTAGMSARQFVALLNSGDVIRYSITLPEGITLAQALRRMHSTTGLVQTLSGTTDPALQRLVADYPSPEGWFLPETYSFTRGDSDLDVLTRAHNAMKTELAEAWSAKADDLPLSSPYEALILASIVERETAVASERPTIAGVFTRRLDRGMRLQTDPTVIYGLGDGFSGNLTRAHLKDATNRWNTYQITGLPPTPIALPGKAALQAVAQPEPGDALYFVARGDGYHAFSATNAEHNANVRRYQLRRKDNYRSTPVTPEQPASESSK